jgi:hypothetical protein
MLVYYFGYIKGSVQQVATALTDSVGEMSVWAHIAYREGEELRTRIGAGTGVPAKAIGIDVGEPVYRAGTVIVPISWKATGVGALFPVMNADLVLEPMGENLVQVVLRGSYQPPLGGVGRLLDRALLHRLAQASAKSFLDQLCAAIEATIGEEEPAAQDLPGGQRFSTALGADLPASSDGQEGTDSGALTDTTADGGLPPGLLGPLPQVRNP